MTFPKNGQSHFIGIKNEKYIVNYLNNNSGNLFTKYLENNNNSQIKLFQHQGGTKQKRDASYTLENGIIKGISIKNHKTGTFDWINTTKEIPADLISDIIKFKQQNIGKFIPNKGGIREDLENIFSNYLNNLTSENIKILLSKIYKSEENTDIIIINNKKNTELVMIPESNLDLYCNPIHNHTYILKSTSRAKTSRQIWIRNNDGSEINTNLRVRLNLNNGITALLGKSKSNKTSVPCLKIQQDNVDSFITNCFDKIIIKY